MARPQGPGDEGGQVGDLQHRARRARDVLRLRRHRVRGARAPPQHRPVLDLLFDGGREGGDRRHAALRHTAEVQPPPALLLRDFDLYLAQVNMGGGIVLLKYLQFGGFPIRMWQYAARTGDGRITKKLFAYSFHICRSVVHKPVCVQILLLGLLGFECALPALQDVLLATTSLSLLGRAGSNIFVDRLLEYINNIQQGAKRSAHAASFGRAIDMTTLLRAIMHVRHVFQATEHGESESDDPISNSMLIQARLVQDYLLEKLGRDLTVHNPNNPLWKTGNAVPLDGGDYRARTPWEWPSRVQDARSAGKHRAAHERWDDFALRFVTEHFFSF